MWEDNAAGIRSLCFRQSERSMLRCVEVNLGENCLVYGPLPQATEAHLRETRPTWLVAPNHYHNMGLQKWSAAHGATAHAAANALPRIRKQTPGPVGDLTSVRLSQAVRFLQPPGTRTGELWVRVQGQDGVTWIVGDAFLNVPAPLPNTFEGWMLALTLNGPGLRVGSTFLWFALDDAKAYGHWLLDQLVEDRPIRLIPAHGEVLEAPDLWSQLTTLVRRRVGV